MSLPDKCIVLTGTEETIRNIATRLSPQQAGVLEFPTIAVKTLDNATNQTILQEVNQYDWLAFTSKQGVRSFFEMWGKNDLPPQVKLAVIGAKTREVLLEYGVEPDFVSHGKDKNDMLEEWQESIRPNEKILLVVSALADDSLRMRLAEIAEVIRMDVYTSHPPNATHGEIHARLVAEKYDMVVFTSPSSVKHYQEMIGHLPAGEQVLAIGPTTSNALREAGCKKFLEAAKPSAESIVEKLEEFYADQKSEHGIS
jgi:uroporphyrinogen-III synthase